IVFADMLKEFGILEKMLSVTCDNTSNNNVMVDELEILVPECAGEASHTWCFLHTVNLIAKSLIQEFDVSKKDAEHALNESADTEDGEDKLIELNTQYSEDDDLQDNNDGWVNEVDLLPKYQSTELQKNIRPVKLVLVKVC
ncbi:hypothetical protein CY34DRAFT_102009, partial [Suillus luteus UH-Slu-Lm8-n1]